jgi:phosphate transport system substrate-binding protein
MRMLHAPSTQRRQMLQGLALSAIVSPWSLARAQLRQPGELFVGGTGSGAIPFQKALDGAHQLHFVPNLGTSGGLKALAAGAIDLALSARNLTEAEKAQGLVERELFQTPVVFAVNSDVPLRRATLAELAALYAGRTASWSSGMPVRLVLRPDTDSDSRFLKSMSPAMAEALVLAQARPGATVATTDTDATEALERIGGSLGMTTLGLVRAEGRRLQVLELDGVKPGIDTLLAKRYPFGKAIFLATRGTPSAELQAIFATVFSRKVAQAFGRLGCHVADAA